MNIAAQKELPGLFEQLMEKQAVKGEQLVTSGDGFYAAVRSVADILACFDIRTVPGEEEELDCSLFFDDWYLYAVSAGGTFTYSLFKMREQEYDARMGRKADGDTPGVTVSFIEMEIGRLTGCLEQPTEENRRLLGREINRVVAHRGQQHSRVLKEYFIRTEARGAYLIAGLYTGFIASLAREGSLPVPERYAAEACKRGTRGRLPEFLEENNRAAGYTVCDGEQIYIRDSSCPTKWERLAILATHTGNVSAFSFAAEVQFHARFLTGWAKIPIPLTGKSVYASAVRADMSIADAEMVGPTPYYKADSRLVREQYACHRDEIDWG